VSSRRARRLGSAAPALAVALAAVACLAVPVMTEAAVAKPGKSIAQRLTRAGYPVTAEQDGGSLAAMDVHIPGTKATSTSPGGNVSIYVYRSASDAAKVLRTFDSMLRKHPNYLRVTLIGAHLYVGTVERPAVLPVATYNQIVAAAEGR
jgi:hypothetical protein